MEKVIRPASSLRGEVAVPGDKSISHRALMMSAISDGEVLIRNLSPGKDVETTRRCLEALGVSFQEDSAGVRVSGRGLLGFRQPDRTLDAGNSGTTMRILTGLLAAQHFSSTITGDSSLQKRDMKRILDPLRLMGGKISSENGFAPLHIIGSDLHGISYRMPIASAQVKSSLLLAGLHAGGVTEIRERTKTRDHTERMLRHFGVSVRENDLTICLKGGSRLKASEVVVPGDFSSAAFLIAAALLVPDSEIILRRVGMNPTRSRFLDLLKSSGARIEIQNCEEVSGEPRGDIWVRSSGLTAFDIAGPDVPLLIDEIPVLAILAAQAQGTTLIRGAEELRKKESDRIHALSFNLQRMGARVEELPDGMRIHGGRRLRGGAIRGFQDHRIVMAFAVAGLIAEGETTLLEAEWSDISFPDFFETIRSLKK